MHTYAKMHVLCVYKHTYIPWHVYSYPTRSIPTPRQNPWFSSRIFVSYEGVYLPNRLKTTCDYTTQTTRYPRNTCNMAAIEKKCSLPVPQQLLCVDEASRVTHTDQPLGNHAVMAPLRCHNCPAQSRGPQSRHW